MKYIGAPILLGWLFFLCKLRHDKIILIDVILDPRSVIPTSVIHHVCCTVTATILSLKSLFKFLSHMEKDDAAVLWPCTQCTFLNVTSTKHCTVCGHPSPSMDNLIVDLTEKNEDDDDRDSFIHTPSHPWQPVYHFQSPPLRETSPHIDQRDHLCLVDIITEEAEAVVLINYLVDIPFLVNQCPALRNSEVNMLLLHGSKGTFCTSKHFMLKLTQNN